MLNHVHTINYTPDGISLLNSVGAFYGTWAKSLLNENRNLKDNRYIGYHVGAKEFYVNSVCADEVLIQYYTQHQKEEENYQFITSFSGWMYK